MPLPQHILDLLGCYIPLTNYEVTSIANRKYNCHAWAAETVRINWGYYPSGFWPSYVASDDFTLSAFIKVFSKERKYEICSDGHIEEGYQKIAFYGFINDPKDVKPTTVIEHTARQLIDGRWASKLGECQDIVHNTEFDIEGSGYGRVVQYMKRRRKRRKRHRDPKPFNTFITSVPDCY